MAARAVLCHRARPPDFLLALTAMVGKVFPVQQLPRFRSQSARPFAPQESQTAMGLFDFFRKKPSSTAANGNGAEPKSDQITRHCFVLCRGVGPDDLSRASDVVTQVFGRGYSAEVSEEHMVTVQHGDDVVGFLAHMPAPIPGQEAEANADGNILWPNGKEAAAGHRSHVIVTNVGAGEQTPVQSALAVSRLALAALKLFDGLGVYWGNAHVCNSRELFEEFCGNMSEDSLPVPMWLRFQFVRPANGEVGLYTLGMSQFGLMDIEVDRCRRDVQDLFEFVSNIAHYLIQQGPVIADGNTVGGSADERILVRHRPSMVEPQRRVYKIVFEG